MLLNEYGIIIKDIERNSQWQVARALVVLLVAVIEY